MKHKSIPLAALIAAAFAGSAAVAQNTASTPPGATPTPRDLATTAAAAGSAPATRAEVQAATKAKVDARAGKRRCRRSTARAGPSRPAPTASRAPT
jgi:hypothetical protein